MAVQFQKTHRLLPIRRRPNRPWPGADWRCTECNALLGRIKDGVLHIRFGRRHEYFTPLPATCTCRDCGRLNRAEATDPR